MGGGHAVVRAREGRGESGGVVGGDPRGAFVVLCSRLLVLTHYLRYQCGPKCGVIRPLHIVAVTHPMSIYFVWAHSLQFNGTSSHMMHVRQVVGPMWKPISFNFEKPHFTCCLLSQRAAEGTKA